MAKRVSIAVCLTVGACFGLGAACTTIPDNRRVQPAGFDADGGPSAGGGGGADASVGGGTGGGTGGSVGNGTGGHSAGGGSSGASGATSSGGAVNAGGSSANGGSLGAGGAVVSNTGGAPDAGPGLTCGSVVCHDRKVGGASLSACCAGKKADSCGFETGALGVTTCVAVNQPGNLDKTCSDFTVGSSTLKGCCQPNATCGLLVEPAGGPHFGCIDPTQAGVTGTQSCTPPSCLAAGKNCAANSDCCSGGAGQGACITLSGTQSTCTQYCVTNGDCASDCCLTLTSGRGVCAANVSACGTACRAAEETCDKDADCCPTLVCAASSELGPRLCSRPCTKDSECAPEFCVKDAGGRATCSATGTGLCTDTCKYNKASGDTECDDGGPGSGYPYCALGSDCGNCGVRLGGTSSCNDSCGTSKNHVCEDGGTGAVSFACGFGADCTDCGPRLGICSNDCISYANDGSCDDGGPNADTDHCSLGTDCGDCGNRLGGRGQTPCDGSVQLLCSPNGGYFSGDMINSQCECLDCKWDSGPLDCQATVSKCDGKAISACCAPGNPCKFDGDGICDCGGWCDWEKQDCGKSAFGPRCDGNYDSSCNYSNPGTPDQYCDCNGVCSWEAADCASLGTTCKDTCAAPHVHNGVCEDGGVGSDSAVCVKGTDCADCGAR